MKEVMIFPNGDSLRLLWLNDLNDLHSPAVCTDGRLRMVAVVV